MSYISLFVLIKLGISLVESFVIAWIASIFGIKLAFKIIFFVVFIINLFLPKRGK